MVSYCIQLYNTYVYNYRNIDNFICMQYCFYVKVTQQNIGPDLNNLIFWFVPIKLQKHNLIKTDEVPFIFKVLKSQAY